MTIKNKNIGDKNRKISGKKIMLVTALLSGGVVIRVNNHINNSFGHGSKEVINFDLTLESTDVLIDDSGVFYVGQGTPIDNFNIYDFVTIQDESGNVIADKDVTLEWDVKEYFEGTTFGTEGEYLITITATTADGRTGTLEYKLVVKEGHIFEEIKEIGDIEVEQDHKATEIDFQEYFRVLNSATGEETITNINSTLEDEDLRSVGTTQVIFYTELNGTKFTNSVDISVVDTVAPVIELEDSFDKLEDSGYEWDNDERTINIKDLEKETSDFLLEEFATAYDGSGEYDLSWDFDEVMNGNMDVISGNVVTIRAVDPSGNESTPIEINVNVSTTTIKFKEGFKEVAFDIFHNDILGSKDNHLAGYWFDITDSNNNAVTDVKRISWTLTEEMIRELGEYTVTVEVLDETYKEVIGVRVLKINVGDSIAPKGTLQPYAKTTYEIEVSQNLSVDNLFMYLDGVSGIDELITVDENSGVWGYRFMYGNQEITDEMLRSVSNYSITLQLFDYDIDGNETNHTLLSDANGVSLIFIFDVVDTNKPVVNVVNDVIDLEIVQNATKNMIEINNYAEINDNSGSFTWDLRVKGAQESVMDYEVMLGKITIPEGVALELVVTDASGNTTYSDMLLIVRDTEAPVLELRSGADEVTIGINPDNINNYRNIATYVNVNDNSGRVSIDDLVWDFDQVVGQAKVAGTYYVTITAEDEAGNTAEVVIKFIVVDNEAPTIVVNTKTIEVEANEYTSIGDFEFDENLNDYITVSDNSGNKPNITFDFTDVKFGEIGTYDVIITATDGAGNSSINIIEIKVIAGNPKVNVVKDQGIINTIVIDDQNVFTGIKVEVKDGKIVIERATSADADEVKSHLTVENLLEFLTISGETIEYANWDLTSLDVTTVGTTSVDITVTNNFGKTTVQAIEFVVVYEYDSLIKIKDDKDNFINIEIDVNETRDSAWFRSEYDVLDYIEYRASGGSGNILWRTLELDVVDFNTVGTYIVTAAITDGHDDTEQVSLTLNVIDTTGANITANDLTEIEINSTDSNGYDVNTFASATDNSGQPVVLSWNLSNQVDFQKVGTYVVTIKAVDASGNISELEVTFEIQDTQPPTITVNPGMDSQTIEINSRDASQFNVNSFVTATDNSGVAPELEWTIESVQFNQLGSYTVEITATDASGKKSAVEIITFNIVDTIAPTIDIEPSGLEELKLEINDKTESDYSDWLEDYVTVTDNSNEDITPTWDITSVDFSTVGSYTVVITAADSEGNTTTTNVVFIVADTTGPTITLKDNMESTSYEVFNQLAANLNIDDFVDVSDSSSFTYSWDMNNVNFDRVGTYVVTIKAIDSYGNESIQEITIEVLDETAPVIVITRPDILVSMGKFSSSDFDVNNFATVTDNYDKSVSLTWTIEEVDFDNEGDYKVIVSAVDIYGNEATEQEVIFNVEDNGMILTEEAPFVIEVEKDNEASNFDVNTYFTATRDDGSPVNSVVWNLTDDMLRTYGTHGVILTITFNGDKKVEVEVTLEVIDSTPPTVTVDNASTTIELGDTQAFDALTPEHFVTADDNSSDFTYSWDFDNVVEKTIVNTYTVTILVTDLAGNSTTESVDIIVVDTTKPVLELNDSFDRNNMTWSNSGTTPELSILAGDKAPGEIDLWELVSATDLSTEALTVSWDLQDVELDAIGHYPVTITVSDASNNYETVAITVNVLRATPILNDFNVDKSYNEITVNVDLTNINQAVSALEIVLISGGTQVDIYTHIDFSLDSLDINEVFNVNSNTEYQVVLNYTYATLENNSDAKTITDTKDVKTLSYSQNDVLGTITDVYSEHTKLTVNYEISNELALMSDVELVLIAPDGTEVSQSLTKPIESGTGTYAFTGLLINAEYTVEIRISYDFNDGNGPVVDYVSNSQDVKTLAYTEHDVITDITGITQSPSTLSVDYNITDIYGLIVQSGVVAKLYKASDMKPAGVDVEINDLNGTVQFTGLDANTQYFVVIESRLDLKDGTFVTKETGTQTTTEAYSLDEIVVNIENIVVEYNEITFDYSIFDINNLLANPVDVWLSINGTRYDLSAISGKGIKISDHITVLSNTDYDIQIHFSYDLRDGKGVKEYKGNEHRIEETTFEYIVEDDLTLTSYNLASDTKNIYIDYSLRNLNYIGDMSTLSITIDDLNGNVETLLLSAIFGDVGSIPLEGHIKFSDIKGTSLDLETTYEITMSINYDLKDGKGIKTDYLLIDHVEIKTRDVELQGYNIITAVDRGYTTIDVNFDIQNDNDVADLSTFQIALYDSDGNIVPEYNYVTVTNATTGVNTYSFVGLLSDAEYEVVYRVEHPNYGDSPIINEFIDISRDVSTNTYDTNLIDVDYTITQGLTYLHLENIEILNSNENSEKIDYSNVVVIISYIDRSGNTVTQEVNLGSLTEGDKTEAIFTNLQSNRDVNIEFRLDYDLSDGSGVQSGSNALVRSSDTKTLEYDFTFTVENDEVTVTGLTPGFTGDHLVIFEEVDGYTVRHIASDAFYGDNISFTELTIPRTLESIGDNSFRDADLDTTKLENVSEVIPATGSRTSTTVDAVLVIGDNAFRDNVLTGFDFTTTESIGASAFRNNTLVEVVLSDTVSYVGDEAFVGSLVEKLTTGALLSDENFGTDSFVGNSISELIIGNTGFKSNSLGVAENVYVNSGFKLTYKDSAVGVIPEAAWRYNTTPSDSQVSVIELTIGSGITKISDSAFYGSLLTKIDIGDNVTEIGKLAFAGLNVTSSKLKDVYLGDSIEDIGESAFANNQITTLSLPKTLVNIGDNAFRANKITEISIPDNVVHIGGGAFQNNDITKLSVGELLSDENFGFETFTGNEIDDLTIGNTGFKHSSLGNSSKVFASTGFKLTYADTAIGTIEAGSWRYGTSSTDSQVSVREISIGSGITTIGESAFYGALLTRVEIGDGVTEIGRVAFSGLTSSISKLQDVTLGASIETIGEYAFINNHLTSIVLPPTLVEVGDYAFRGNQISELEIPNNVKYVGDEAFKNNNITKLSVGALLSDENFGFETFVGNEISDLTIGNTGFKHSSLGNSSKVFDSTGFKLTYADTATGAIEPGSWRYGTSTTDSQVSVSEVSIGSGITSIGESAFYGALLKSVVIGENVTEIGRVSFMSLSNAVSQLTTLTLGESVETIGDYAFTNNNITSLKIPSSVISIDSYAFRSNNISTLEIGDVPSSAFIGEDIFNRNNISDLTLGNASISYSDLHETDVFNPNGFSLEYTDTATGDVPANAWRYGNGYADEKITNLTLGENINSIGDYSFAGHGFTSLEIFNTETLGVGSFDGSIISSLTLGNTSIVSSDFTEFGVFRTAGFTLEYTNSAIGAISAGAWLNRTSVSSVTFGNQITTIGDSAFENNRISNVVIPNNVTQLGENAFKSNSITSFTLTTAITELSNGLFEDNNLTTFSIPTYIDTIGERTFANNNIANVYIPNHISEIKTNAFSNNAITGLEFERSTTGYTLGSEIFSENNISVLKLENTEIVNNSLGINNVFSNSGFALEYTNEATGVIPASAWNQGNNINSVTFGNKITSIGDSAFEGNKITSVTIPSNITSLGTSVFKSNNISTFDLGTSITEYSDSLFEDNNISTLSIPTRMTLIGERAFMGNNIASVVIQNHITEIKTNAFSNNAITELEIENTSTGYVFGSDIFNENVIDDLTLSNTDIVRADLGTSNVFSSSGFDLEYTSQASGTIPANAWINGNGVNNITFSVGITGIGNNAFEGNNLTSIVIPDHITSLGDYVFKDNNISTFTLNTATTKVNDGLFENNNISVLTIPTHINTIGERAFAGNNISELFVPDYLTEIKTNAFTGNQMTKLEFEMSTVGYDLGTDVFSQNDINLLTLPSIDMAKEEFGTDGMFSTSGVDLVYTQNATGELGDGIWSNLNSIKSVTFSDGITSIGSGTFEGNMITNIDIPNTITSLGDYAFKSNNISTFTISSAITEIKNGLFENNNISVLTIPSHVDVIGERAFMGNSIAEFVLENRITEVKSNAFADNEIEKLVLETGVLPDRLGTNTFAGNKINELTVSSVEFIHSTLGDASSVFDPLGFKLEYTNATTGVIPENAWRNGDGHSGAKVSELFISDNITGINQFAFMNNSMKVLTIGSSLAPAQIGTDVFVGNVIEDLSLSSTDYISNTLGDPIDVLTQDELTLRFLDVATGSIPEYAWPMQRDGGAENGILSTIKLLVIGDGITMIENRAFIRAEIHTAIIGDKVTEIDDYAFYYSGMEFVTIGSGLKTIGTGAFMENSLKSLVLPASISTIGSSAFNYNDDLATVRFLGGRVINSGAFSSGPTFYNASGQVIT